MRLVGGLCALVVVMGAAAGSAAAAVGEADYDHALSLRDKWMWLTRDVADPAAFVEDSHRFVYRKTVEGGFAFVVVDADTGQKTPAFDQARLAVGLSKATGETYQPLRLPFTGFKYEDKGQAIEAAFDETRWRCTLADYVCKSVPFEKGQPRGFGVVRDLKIPADNSPKLSPDGKREAFVQNFNIVVRTVGAKDVVVLSTDGSEGEFYDPESIVWSPDSSKLAAYRVRPGFHRIVYKVQSSPPDQVQPKLTEQLYPKPGDAVDIDRPVLFQVDRSRAIPIDTALFANPYEMTKFIWRKDSSAVTFEYDQRGHQVYRVIEADAETGVPRAEISEEPKTFVNTGRMYRHDIDGLGREVIWMSERDGWNHLYLLDAKTGKVKTQITKGPWVVHQVLKVDDRARQVWFTAGGMDAGEDPYFVHAYRIGFDGKGLTPLTPAKAYHDVTVSTDLKYYVDTYSRVDLAPVSELHRADGFLVGVVEKGDISQLLAAGWKPPEVFIAKGRDGKTDIWGVIVRPLNFDPSRKYPVIENIYAGPHDSFVPKTFWPFGYHSGGDKMIGMQEQAEMGFIVVQMDGMGTLNRSKAFHDVAWKNLGDAGFPDRIAWHRAVATKYPWYDISRVGIYGGSAGGQESLAGLLFHPEFYKVAVSYAGCHDNRMDKISWNEQWLGWPVDDSYSKSSNVDNAWRLKGQVLLIVGELDMNVDPSSTLQVVDKLIKADKTFDFLMVPGYGHTAGRSSGPIRYALRKQYEFFVRNLIGDKAPDWNAGSDGRTVAPN